MSEEERSRATADRLVKEQIISEADLAEARKREELSGTPWYRQLVHMNKLSFNTVNDVLHYEFHSKTDRRTHDSLGKTLINENALTQKQLKAALASRPISNGCSCGNMT